ncbi:hypothetical protein BU17DRAFT_92905 [Hysterangium stoloniferum]|nr:hypothetical protein BU17DRAFT_92905 [Hysterangium stoloniferum]
MSSQQQFNNNNQQGQVGPPKNISNDDLLLYIVCFFCPPLAIFWLKNGCEQEVILTLILWLLFWFPGFIYALYLIMQNQKAMQQRNQQGSVA